ncbi:DsbA family protein [Candidatus Pacearchaeota archaeon]|nr:DsbA family protein [Candidatus Pacearchaeota archaeon]
MNDETITINKQDLWKYSTFVLLGIVVIGLLFFFVGNVSVGNAVNDPTTTPGTTAPSVVKASADNDAVLGDKNAPITIIEFSDYQCPFCRQFWATTFVSIKSEYIDTGKVKFVYRDFPLSSIHPMAEPSAEAAECVKDKGGDAAYYKYHDKIFSEQNILDSGSANGQVTKTVTYSTNDLKKWAKDLGYNIDSCLDSGKFNSEVQKDLADGISDGVQGTPGFMVISKNGLTDKSSIEEIEAATQGAVRIVKTSDGKEGVFVGGALPFSAFQQVIEAFN